MLKTNTYIKQKHQNKVKTTNSLKSNHDKLNTTEINKQLMNNLKHNEQQTTKQQTHVKI